MTNAALQTRDDGSAEVAALPSIPISEVRQRRRFFLNRLADVVVRLSGLAVLFSIAAIFLVILLESLPLFRKANAELKNISHLSSSARTILAGYSADGQTQFAVYEDNSLEMAFTGSRLDYSVRIPLSLPHQGDVVSAAQVARERNSIYLGASNGYVYRVEVPQAPFRVGLDAEPLVPAEEFMLDELARPVRMLKVVKYGSTLSMVSAIPNEPSRTELKILTERPGKGLMNSGKPTRIAGTYPFEGIVTALALSTDGSLLYVGSESGDIAALDIRHVETASMLAKAASVSSHGSISALSLLLGDQTLAVGRSTGEVDTWMFAGGTPFGGGKLSLKSKVFHASSAITSIAASSRNRSFLSISHGGELGVHFGTSGATQLVLQSSIRDALLVGMTNRGDDFFVLGENGALEDWTLDNPHPEISLGTLFLPVWYEGYSAAELVWQSSSGSDEFEPKFSLTPLLYGTFKGTLYSLLFAVPLALLGAIYVAEFMSPSLRGIVKPTLELMAALPSVVIGFIAGLWLAPNLGPYIPTIFVFPAALLMSVALAHLLWVRLPETIRARVPGGVEVLLLLPVVIFSFELASVLGSALERSFLGGDYQRWLSESFGIVYDQRNSMVVGLAMGFAIIPIIFTLAEDSLSSVPRQLAAGSLALGASRWQTALRVVIPAASPGIFSAIMLGFGRAVGETMIVLMATGNTPLMDGSPFNGFRALSANIAVELPEAAAGSTLFRVLFFAALLLFALTFLVNTLTELVRQRLRRRYSLV